MRVARLTLPSTNRTCRFPASGSTRELSPQTLTGGSCFAFWPSFCLKRESFSGSLCRASVVGLASKRLSLLLTQHVPGQAPSLHDRYSLLCYYEPVRLPASAPRQVIYSLTWLVVLPTALPGLPGSSTSLYTRAVPFHPGESGDCSHPLLHRR